MAMYYSAQHTHVRLPLDFHTYKVKLSDITVYGLGGAEIAGFTDVTTSGAQ